MDAASVWRGWVVRSIGGISRRVGRRVWTRMGLFFFFFFFGGGVGRMAPCGFFLCLSGSLPSWVSLARTLSVSLAVETAGGSEDEEDEGGGGGEEERRKMLRSRWWWGRRMDEGEFPSAARGQAAQGSVGAQRVPSAEVHKTLFAVRFASGTRKAS